MRLVEHGVIVVKCLGYLVPAFIFCACNLGRPQVTLTLAPIETRTSVATDAVELPTETLVRFDLPSATLKASPTGTDIPRITSTAVATATDTALPVETDTPEPAATVSPNDGVPPTFTALPTFDETELAELLATAVPRSTVAVTWTAVPTSPSTSEVGIRPAVSTPAVATATADRSDPSISTALASTAQPQLGAATLSPTPTATRFQPTVAVRQELIVDQINQPVFQPPSVNTIGASVYQYGVDAGQIFAFEGLQLGGGVLLFAPNPVNDSSFIRTDQRGVLQYRPINALHESELVYSPFFLGFGSQIRDANSNKNFVAEIDWSADGSRFTFRIDTPPGQDNGNAGVWFWQPLIETANDPTYQLIRDCVSAGYKPCNFVNPSNALHWKTIDVAWSPVGGSNDILLTVELTQENRQAIALVRAAREARYANQAPEFFRYDYGHWNVNGQGIVVSGRRPDGTVIIGSVNNSLTGEQVHLDASARGLWMQDAVRRPNGQIYALGRPGGPHDNAPVTLYDVNGRALSAPIGDAAPDAVRWFPDRSAVVVTVRDRQFAVQVDGGIITDTTDLTRDPRFGGAADGTAMIPSAVIRGSEYRPGQQLRTVQSLNVRQGPSTSSQIIGGLLVGDYVAVVAGPYDDANYRWWKVQTASNIVGWIAGTIGGQPTIRSG